MENASKALLIAGGILILIILVSLMLIVRNNVTNFYASQDELQMTTDRAKFNEQFTRYNRDDVEGYELISLANKVIDYNERVSDKSYEGNNSQAEPITLSITLWKNVTEKEEKVKTLLTYDNTLRLFTKSKLIEKENVLNQDPNSETNLDNILEIVKSIKEINPKADVIVKQLSNIFVDLKKTSKNTAYTDKSKLSIYNEEDKKIIEENRQNMLSAISVMNAALGTEKYKFEDSEDQTNPKTVYNKYIQFGSTANKIEFYKYYEYIQFTKAKFKCTKMDYSQTTGRVTNLEFVFTGEIE